MKRTLCACVLAIGLMPADVAAEDVDPARVDLFSMLLEMNGCRMNNFEPNERLIKNLESNDFDRNEVRAIGQFMLEEGMAEKQGDYFVLKIQGC